MDIRAEIAVIEAALRKRGKSVAALCRDAGIYQSQWQRWKRGEALPNMRSWQRILAAVRIYGIGEQVGLSSMAPHRILPEFDIAARIIEKCGGPRAVAEICGVDVSRVHRWKYPPERGGTGGIIPASHQITLLEGARAAGINLRPDDFFPVAETGPGEGAAS